MTEPLVTCEAVTGIGEVGPGDDLAAMLAEGAGLRDGDVLVVTSKVVSKAEGRVVTGDRDERIDEESDRVVARRGPTRIVRTRHGLVMAAAGIDASNTAPGTLVLLPLDPDGSARLLRERLASAGPNVAVLVSDTSGRAWRNGQTDIAVGAAGLEVLDDHAGRADGYGNSLTVTAPATADEITGLADLVTGKLSRCPAALVRGLGHLVLPRGEHGPGARALIRPEEQDMFGYGAREAVLHALTRTEGRGFGAPVSPTELTQTLTALFPESTVRAVGHHDSGRDVVAVELTLSSKDSGRHEDARTERATVAAFCLGWRREGPPETVSGAATRLRFLMAGP